MSFLTIQNFAASIAASELYPHCCDDESRGVLYNAQGGEAKAPTLRRLCEGFTGLVSTNSLPELDHIRKSLETVLTCPVPAWPGDALGAHEEVKLLHSPTEIQSWIRRLKPQWSDLFPKHITPDALLVNHFNRGLRFSLQVTPICSRDDRSFPVLDYSHLFDALLISAWHDVAQQDSSYIEFRPRWTLRYPKTSPVACGHVPDVVISAIIPCSANSGLQEQLKAVHPEHNCEATSESARDFATVPLLIVEYVKACTDYREKSEDIHFQHLGVGMGAALEIYRMFSIQTPILGLLFSRFDVTLVVGYLKDGTTSFKKVRMHDMHRPYDLNNKLDCVLLRSIIKNIGHLVPEVRATITMLKNGHGVVPPRCGEKLHVMDPSVVDDDACIAIYNDPEIMTEWLSSRLVSVVSPPLHSSTAVCTVDFKELVSLFLRYTLPSSLSEEVLRLCRARLTSSEIPLWAEFVADYKRFLSASSTEYSDIGNKIDPFLKQVSNAITLSSIARTLTRHKARHSSWSALFDSMLLLPVSLEGPKWVILRYSVNLAIHKSEAQIVQNAPEVFDAVTIDAVVSSQIEAPFFAAAFTSHPELKDRFLPEFNTFRDTDECEGGNVKFPVLLVEHVKSHSGRSQHLNHLAIAMKTALGQYGVLNLPPIVLGLLCNRNIVSIIACYRPDPTARESVTTEIKRFDVCRPMEALALRVTLENVVAHAERLENIVEGSTAEIAAPFLDGSFVPWRHDSVLRSLDSDEEEDAVERVKNWQSGLLDSESDSGDE